MAYYSRKRLPRETRYATVEIKYLAVVNANQNFGVYHSCYGQEVHGEFPVMDENSWLTRWALML